MKQYSGADFSSSSSAEAAKDMTAEQSPVLTVLLKCAKLLVTAGLIAAYIPHLVRSFWVDEAGTFWMARGGPLAAARRTLQWPGQSILYSIISSLFLFERGPFREIALRLPSLLGAAAACYFLYRFAEDAIGKGSGRAAAVLFLFTPATIDFATQARPYAAAMAATAASCWTLFRWTKRGERSWLAAYVIATAAVFYFHYIFAVILMTHAVIFICGMIRKRGALPWKELAGGYCAIVLLLMPIIPHLLRMFHAAHTFGVDHPTAADLIGILVPDAYFTGILIAGVLVYIGWRGTTEKSEPLPRSSAAILFTWWIAGPVFLFGLAAITSAQVTYLRYLLYSGMGFVLILVSVAYSIFGAKGTLTFALLAILTTGNLLRITALGKPGPDELLPAMRAIADESVGQTTLPPVMVRSPFEESNFGDWQAGNIAESHFYAPFTLYPMKNEMVPLPYRLTDSVKVHVTDLIRGRLKDEHRILFFSSNDAWTLWMDDELRRDGFSVRWVRPNGLVVGVFEHSVSSPAR